MTANEIVDALRECADPEHWDCQGCKYEDTMKVDRCRSKLMEAAADLIEQQQAEIERLKAEAPKWISVEERLPEEGEIVLAMGAKHASVGMFQGTGKHKCYWWWRNTLRKTTHWMPVPKPIDVRAVNAELPQPPEVSA